MNLDKIINEWKQRNLIKEINNFENFKKIIESKQGVYCGIDPTQDSLHLGHLVPLTLMKELSLLGCPIFVVIGGATAQIGDPSFRNSARNRLSYSQIQQNVLKIEKQLKILLPKVEIFNNFNWYKKMNILDFLSNISSLFTVKKMLQKESLSSALDKNILFHSHFSYILMQAYDFYYLWKKHNCYLQIGGSDQLPNIIFGIDLIKKLNNKPISLCGVTTNLLLNLKGEKISKSFGNESVWLDNKKNSFYQMYQFFYNLEDNLIQNWTKLFNGKNPSLQKEEFKKRSLHKKLFFFLICWIFDPQTEKNIQKCFKALENNLFTQNNLELMHKINFINQFSFSKQDLEKISIVDLLKITKITDSKTFARRLISQKAIYFNNQIIIQDVLVNTLIVDNQKIFILKKGKKDLILIKIK